MKLALASGCPTGPPSYIYDNPTPEEVSSPSQGKRMALCNSAYTTAKQAIKAENKIKALELQRIYMEEVRQCQ
jgi:hypothetical protein